MCVAAVVVAAGSGERLGAAVPKAFVEVRGVRLVDWAIKAFVDHPEIRVLVVVAPAEWVSSLSESSPLATVVAGGGTRQESVDLGLAVLGPEVEFVLVHDAARPLVSATVITSVIAKLRAGAEAVIPVLPIVDTIKRVDVDGAVLGTIERSDLRAVQTPQGFRVSTLVRAHAAATSRGITDVSDDAGLIEAIGGSVVTVPGSATAMKITTQYDLALVHHLAGP